MPVFISYSRKKDFGGTVDELFDVGTHPGKCNTVMDAEFLATPIINVGDGLVGDVLGKITIYILNYGRKSKNLIF